MYTFIIMDTSSWAENNFLLDRELFPQDRWEHIDTLRFLRDWQRRHRRDLMGCDPREGSLEGVKHILFFKCVFQLFDLLLD